MSLTKVSSPMIVGSTVSKSSAYTATDSDYLISVSGSGAAFSLTLPTAVGRSGKRFKVVRSDLTLANIVTIATTSAQTINGKSSFKIATQYEMVEVESDGSNWIVISRFIPSEWTAYTPTYTAFGTVSTTDMWYRRDGDSIEIKGRFTVQAVSGTIAAFSLPSGLSIHATKNLTTKPVGFFYNEAGGAGRTEHGGAVLATASGTGINFGSIAGFSGSSIGDITTPLSSVGIAVATDVISMSHVVVPITNWEG